MKKFNVINEIISIPHAALMAALAKGTEFGITINGEIVYPPYDNTQIYVFKGTPVRKVDISEKPEMVTDILGSRYLINVEEKHFALSTEMAWQSMVDMNLSNACFIMTTTRGIFNFPDDELKAMGWHATEFDIGFEDIINAIQTKVKGTLFCYEEHEDSYHFSGMGFFKDREKARKTARDYIVKTIKAKMKKEPCFCDSMIDEDQEEALAFFNIAVNL